MLLFEITVKINENQRYTYTKKMKEIAEHLSYKWEMKYKDILIWFDFRSYSLKRTCKFIYLLTNRFPSTKQLWIEQENFNAEVVLLWNVSFLNVLKSEIIRKINHEPNCNFILNDFLHFGDGQFHLSSGS